MTYEELVSRVSVDPRVCGGKPCIRGTRIYIAIILGGLAEGLTPALDARREVPCPTSRTRT